MDSVVVESVYPRESTGKRSYGFNRYPNETVLNIDFGIFGKNRSVRIGQERFFFINIYIFLVFFSVPNTSSTSNYKIIIPPGRRFRVLFPRKHVAFR